ncbi:MAG: hypothetical protein M3066_09510, partial [Actinomycetota bacterium]|nr:hypothetical protein [Actinomycetota bacterium]
SGDAGGSANSAAAAGGSANGGAAATAAPTTGDLGEIPDAPTLLARAGPGIAAKATSPVPSGPATTPNAAGAINPVAPSVVGTRPCEEQARTRDPSLGEVVYFATATHQGAPAVVLGFSTGPAPVTLLLLAQADCGVLLRAAGP